jgi:tetratricopeptide (TPR) repeat protein
MVKVTAEPYECKKTYLRELTRMLLYMLVDLDETPLNGQGAKEMSKQVNRCVLNILETSNARHVMEILFLLGKRHLQLNLNVKLVHIIIKCIDKTIKYTDFSNHLAENIHYILRQNEDIFEEFGITPDSVYFRTFKGLYYDLFKIYPLAQDIFEEARQNKPQHPTTVHIYNDYLVSLTQEPEPLAEQSKEAYNTGLSAVRSLGPISVSKLVSIKKARQEGNS